MENNNLIESEYIDIAIIFDSNMNNFPFTLQDLNNFRKINKNYNKAIKDFKYVRASLYNQFTILCDKSTLLGYDIIFSLKNSDINLLEFERIVTNMNIICNRKYGQKYGYLIEQKLINKYKLDDYTIEHTLNVYKCLYNYSVYLMSQQKYAPTELTKYVILWMSDYVRYIYIKKYPYKQCNIIFSSLISDKNIIYLNNFNIYKFYESIVNCNNKTYIHTDQHVTTHNDLVNITKIWIDIHIYTKEYYCSFIDNATDITSNYILLAIIDFLYNTIKYIGTTDISNTLMKVLKDKCNELFNDTNNISQPIYIRINRSLHKLIELLN